MADNYGNVIFLTWAPYTLKYATFYFVQTRKWIAPLERAGKTGQVNGMVYYVWMCGYRDIEAWKSGKMH